MKIQAFTTFFSSRSNWGRLCMIIVLAFAMTGPAGCRNKKKLAEEQRRLEEIAEREAAEAKAAQELNSIKASLQDIIDNPARSFIDLANKEATLADIKSKNIKDRATLVLINQAEYAIEKDRERLNQNQQNTGSGVGGVSEGVSGIQNELSGILSNIAGSGSTGLANARINQALEMFSHDDVPVLVIISQSGGRKDYDRPTTIRRYLNYLKDQGKNPNTVESIVLDDNGKIQELELIKR